MKELLLVGFGGAIGSIARYLSSSFVNSTLNNSQFPYGTLLVNVLGCFLIGLLSKSDLLNQEQRLLLCTGFLGGFTTFSAFGLETMNLIRDGHLLLAIGNVVLSVSLGLLAIFTALKLS